MAGAKRSLVTASANDTKRLKVDPGTKSTKPSTIRKPTELPLTVPNLTSSDELDSDSDEADADPSADTSANDDSEAATRKSASSKTNAASRDGNSAANEEGSLKANGSTSKESHAKQKALVQERKASKPNADLIARTKKIWERLRLKSHVPIEERKKLVTELFGIITGRVHDFVFKHDSVRVIQTALKYGNLEQRKLIARELKSEYKMLAESRYAKFLIGKLMVHGDSEIRDLIIPEFYGHVKRLIRHPEASWIVDDIYRTVATEEQKAKLLREWYGPEFVIFKSDAGAKLSADLSAILEANPEKRGPVMQHLHELTNQLVQKKTTGFTMLHDAMLQYFLNTKEGSAEFNESIQMLLDDEEGDCLKNLAFTKSGAQLVCLTLAHATAKDRKLILRHYKTTMKMLANDQYGHMILLAAYDVIDDTVMSSKSIFPEVLFKDVDETTRDQELLAQSTDLTARIPLIYLFNPPDVQPKWLLSPQSTTLLSRIHSVRLATSKKDPETRRKELLKSIAQPLLDLIASQTHLLLESTTGTQFISEILFGSASTLSSPECDLTPALSSIVSLAASEPPSPALSTPSFGRLLKSLVQGGKFDPATKTILKTADDQLPLPAFASMLFDAIKPNLLDWATGKNSFVIVAMLERESDTFEEHNELKKLLKETKAMKRVRAAAEEDGNAGARILVKLLH